MSDRDVSVFISSPQDVADERVLARDVIERLARRYRYFCDLKAVMWEWEPIRAGGPFPDVLPKPSESDIVIVILWSRLGHDLPAESRFIGPDGEPMTGTEWEFLEARRALIETGGQRPDLLVFRKTQNPIITYESDAQLDEFRVQRQKVHRFFSTYFQDEKGSYVTALRDFSDVEEFETILEEGLRTLVETRIEESGTEEPIADLWGENPFRGLASFNVKDSPIFFGRTRARHELRNLLKDRIDQDQPSLLVTGSSGAGKSSLVKAGLIADLKKPGVIGNLAVCRHVAIRPSDAGGRPVRALAEAILNDRLPELSEMCPDVATLEERLRSSDARAVTGIGKALDVAVTVSGHQPPRFGRLVVLIDQFEEIFSLADMGEVLDLIGVLESFLASGQIWLIATLRQDFLHRLEEVPGCRDLFSHGLYFLEPPRLDEISQMIRMPARYAGVRFEQDEESGRTLANELEREAEKDPYALPLLQFVLERLFENRSDDGILRFADYERIGRLGGAIAYRAQQAISHLTEEELSELDSILRSLVTVSSPDAPPTAVWSDRSALEKNSIHTRIVSKLLDERLLVASGNDSGSRIRLVHEALIRNWDRLRHVAAEHRHFLRVRDQLRAQAHQYAVDGYESDLLVGRRLYEAEALLDGYADEFEPEIVDYIRASLALAEEKKKEEEAQAAAELETQRRIAEQQTLLAEASNRARRLARGGLIAVTALLVLAAGAAIWALILESDASDKIAANDQATRVLREIAEYRSNGDYVEILGAVDNSDGLFEGDLLSGFAKAALYFEFGDIYHWLSNRDSFQEEKGVSLSLLGKSREMYGGGLDILESVERMIDAAVVIETLAQSKEESGDKLAAAGDYRDAAEIRERIVELDPFNSECRCKIATDHSKRAELLAKLDEVEAAVEARRDAITVYEEWVRDQPDTESAWLGNLVAAYQLAKLATNEEMEAVAAEARVDLAAVIQRILDTPEAKASRNQKLWNYMAILSNYAGRPNLAVEVARDAKKVGLRSDRIVKEQATALLAQKAFDQFFSLGAAHAKALAEDSEVGAESARRRISELFTPLLDQARKSGVKVTQQHLRSMGLPWTPAIAATSGSRATAPANAGGTTSGTGSGATAATSEPAEELVGAATDEFSQAAIDAAFEQAPDAFEPLTRLQQLKLKRDLLFGAPVAEALRRAYGLKFQNERRRAEAVLCGHAPAACDG